MIFDEKRRKWIEQEVKNGYILLTEIHTELSKPMDGFQFMVDKLLGVNRKEHLEHAALHILDHLIFLKKELGEDTEKEQAFLDEFKNSGSDCFDSK